MTAWANKWMAIWPNGWLSDRATEQPNERPRERLRERVNEWMNDWLIGDQSTKWVTDRPSEWASEWASEWVIKGAIDEIDKWVIDHMGEWISVGLNEQVKIKQSAWMINEKGEQQYGWMRKGVNIFWKWLKFSRWKVKWDWVYSNLSAVLSELKLVMLYYFYRKNFSLRIWETLGTRRSHKSVNVATE